MTVLLVGSGKMAIEYAKVLQHLKRNFIVVGRGVDSARVFEEKIGVPVLTGGINKALNTITVPTVAIITVGVDSLATTAYQLISFGVKEILLEKPGALHQVEIESLTNLAEENCANLYIAFNRRFYESTAMLRKLVLKDGGIRSCIFEFTEWSNVISKLNLSDLIKSKWFLANSMHVIDLVFHLCGIPEYLHCKQDGSLTWHPSASRFWGCGLTNKGVAFSYLSDWEGPGRWGVELITSKNRFILRPMEELKFTPLNSFQIEGLNIKHDNDGNLKPGLLAQTKAFLSGDNEHLCNIYEHLQNFKIYERMAGYEIIK